jgi:type III restriction enzyme
MGWQAWHGGVDLLSRFNQPAGQALLDFKSPGISKSETRRRLFVGFSKCCYAMQAFHSDDERRFAVIVDRSTDVLRWVKPARQQFMIEYHRGKRYEPDFVIGTKTEKLIAEVKAREEMATPEVTAKANAARTWVNYASCHANTNGSKPWRYVLIPHDSILGSSTLAGLVPSLTLPPIDRGAVAERSLLLAQL